MTSVQVGIGTAATRFKRVSLCFSIALTEQRASECLFELACVTHSWRTKSDQLQCLYCSLLLFTTDASRMQKRLPPSTLGHLHAVIAAKLAWCTRPLRALLGLQCCSSNNQVWCNSLKHRDNRAHSTVPRMFLVQVFEAPQRRQTLYSAGGIVAVVLLLYYLVRWRRA